eukprot:3668420-Amphidinium_carterae.1
MRRSIQSYLLATASAPKPVPMDLGCIPWSNKGKGKDGKNKKSDKGKGGKDGWWNKGGKAAKEIWLRACHLKKLRMVGPVHVTIHLLRALKLEVRKDGTASDGVIAVQFLVPPAARLSWQHDVRELLRFAQLRILVRRRPTFAGAENGVDRKACLHNFNTLKDPCECGVLEHFLCGGLVPNGEYGDFRPEDSRTCPFCLQEDLSTQRVLWSCARFQHIRRDMACLFGRVSSPCDGLTLALVAVVHSQVDNIWQAKIGLEKTFHYDGWPVRLKKLRCLQESTKWSLHSCS